MDRWQSKTWGDIATLEYGKGLRDYQEGQGRFPVYGTNGQIGWHQKSLCPHPGVIIGRKGAYRGVHYSDKPFYVIDTAFYLAPKEGMDLRWAYYQLLTIDINSMDSGSAIPSTSREDFYHLPVAVPPLDEQHAIADFLSAFDDKIELNRQMNETLEAMARAIFKSWFVDFDAVHAKARGEAPVGMTDAIAALFPEGFIETELGPIPKGWEVTSAMEEFDVNLGQSPPGSTYNEEGDGLPFYQGSKDFAFRYPEYRVYCTEPKRLAQPNDTLVSVRAPVGDVNMAFETCCIGRGLWAVRHKSGSRSYTYYAMQKMKEYFDRFNAEGTVFGSLSKRKFTGIPVLSPPRTVVDCFEEMVSPMDEMLENNMHESRTLAELRDTLLPTLISGELRVPEEIRQN